MRLNMLFRFAVFAWFLIPSLGIARIIDLQVSEMYASSSLSGVSFRFTILNSGLVAADLDLGPGLTDNVKYSAYASEDMVLDIDDDTFIQRGPLQGTVFPGGTLSFSFEADSLLTPRPAPYLIVRIDANNDITESNETNNDRATRFNAPDLVIINFEVTNLLPTSYAAIATIKNVGTGSADLDGPDSGVWNDNVGYQNLFSYNTIYNSPDSSPAGGSYLFEPLPVLQPEQTYTMQVSGGRANQEDRTYVVMWIDSFNKMEEANEDNNTAAALLSVPGEEFWVIH